MTVARTTRADMLTTPRKTPATTSQTVLVAPPPEPPDAAPVRALLRAICGGVALAGVATPPHLTPCAKAAEADYS